MDEEEKPVCANHTLTSALHIYKEHAKSRNNHKKTTIYRKQVLTNKPSTYWQTTHYLNQETIRFVDCIRRVHIPSRIYDFQVPFVGVVSVFLGTSLGLGGGIADSSFFVISGTFLGTTLAAGG